MLVPVLDAGRLVWDLRMQHDPSAAPGIPPHVTLMFPFIPPSDLTNPIIDALEALINGTRAFEFSLTRVLEFEQGVVYLAPEPAAPFASVSKEIGSRFGLLPFGGAFGDEPVPHLTVGILDSRSRRQQLANLLRPTLPTAVRAEEAWLMVGTNSTSWMVDRRMRFRG